MQKLKYLSLLAGLLLGVQMLCAQDSYILHTVLKGQGLYSIARIYGVTEAEIIALNPGSDKVIRTGEQLKIPQKQINKEAAEETANGYIHHTVQSGETIYRLTITYGVTGEEIYQANPILRTEPLKAGQVVLIPDKKSTVQQVSKSKSDGEEDAEDTPSKQKGFKVKGAYGNKEKASDSRSSDGESFWSRIFGKKKKTYVQPVDTTDCAFQHVVQKGETVFSISRAYGVNEAELLAANPVITDNRIKRGQVLCIPKKSKTQQEETPTGKQQEETPVEEQPKDVTPDVWHSDALQVALILPFMLNENTSTPTADQAKMVEFYEGFLLAIDSLRDADVSIELHVYDSGEATRSIRPILESEEMAHMDIIFGPMHAQHVAQAADFARAHSIPLVLPFSRNVTQLASNPYLWQVNADPSVIEEEGINHFFELFPKPNVLFFQSKGVTDAFCTHLQNELDRREMPYHVFPAETTNDVRPFMEACSRDDQADNILMMTTSDNASLSTMLPVFQLVMRDTAQVADIHLYGYPQYQTYANSHANEFFELDTWYHTAFYTNNNRPDAASLNRKFKRMYGREMGARYPRYGLLGFDIGYWFLNGLSHRLNAPAETVFAGLTTYRCSTIQTGFNFNRVSPTGGYTNAGIYVVHMRADGQIFKVDFAW
ncbi:MAG: LysM peptidoglycan-binding domain-containing protein [Bacteroidaceae bacterium]|nr:LysM peptidoglycan-binding domain-containing protein [Bacteroidaceae bacterium]